MIQPIETSYKGYRFRSRLEARWAVFFDHLGINWEYEPEGFILKDGTYYLPDFRVILPSQKTTVWYEIKPKNSQDDNKLKLMEESWIDSNSGEAVFEVLHGDPMDVLDSGFVVCPRCGLIQEDRYFSFRGFLGCFPCDFDTPCGAGVEEKGLLCEVRPHKGCITVENIEEWTIYQVRVELSAKLARSARFEHGENG